MRIIPEGLLFRQRVLLACRRARIRPMKGNIGITIYAYPPDKRRRDLDNILKAILDALQHAGAYADDSQISGITIYRCHVARGHGFIEISISQRP